MILKQDCKHFSGDRPCAPHKQYGVHCDVCTYYEPVSHRILIIKLDAVGDVLRTTSILPGLKEKYPSSEITWMTLSSAREIFYHNTFVDRVLLCDEPGILAFLSVQRFNLLINLDSSPKSASLASYCQADEKFGFGLDAKGKVFCFSKEAEIWFEMGAFDDIKKNNVRTYQDLMLNICKLKPKDFEIVLNLSESERQAAKEFRQKHSILPTKIVVGMNTGASSRWEQKKWTLDGYRELIRRIVNETEYSVVLYGGANERERNNSLSAGYSGRVIIAETDARLRDFFALLSVSDVVITGDTLALHAATALRKRVIAIFGPTSSAEIETYGRVQKVTSETMSCQCYYQPVCTQEVNCMNTIAPQRIFDLVQREVKMLSRQSVAVISPDA
jgi:ADP-heptose:LPS heptosyltransferase